MKKIRMTISILGGVSAMLLTVLGGVMMFAGEPQTEVNRVVNGMVISLLMSAAYPWWKD